MNVVPFLKNTSGKNLCDLTLASEYRTGQMDMVGDFYAPCLNSATTYNRAVGFFRSTVFHLIHEEIADFARKGGKIRIICSPSLTEQDIKSMEMGYAAREKLISGSLELEIDQMMKEDGLQDRTTALATLIALNVVDIKIAIRPGSLGMYHEKLGIFNDSGNDSVSFKGSANETWNAWHEYGNYESIEVFCSWNPKDSERVANHKRYFEDLWNGLIPTIEIYDFPTAAKNKLCTISKDDLDAVDWKKFSHKAKKQDQGRKPFEHQTQAIANWIANGCLGILEHATGSGKTFTAMIALRDHTLSGGPAVVLVPSKLLLRQWGKELHSEIPEATILKAGDGNIKWKKGRLLRDFTVNDPKLKPRIVLSTMQTAASTDFMSKIASGPHLMVVADECHQTGSMENSNFYSVDAGKRLGLSATPIRYGDPDGTAKMMNYFGGIVEPRFTLDDAIRTGRLVQYEYYPHTVNLTAEEADEWKSISEKVSKEVARSSRDQSGKPILNDFAKMMLIKRARIAKKAIGKERLAVKILETEYQEGDKWLVYCEDKTQLASILQQLKDKKLHVNEYHTSMNSDMDATLDWFRKHGGILVSIRCLDEGVDIPDISHALILASSQNPRQFIQRRGRVLRQAPGKMKAVLHDAIVVPVDMENESEQLSLVKSEFCRAIEFANGALNKSASAHLRKIAIDLGLDIESLANKGTEEEGNE